MIERAPKNPNNITNTFFSTVHLVPKDLRFERGGAKLVSCPGCHLTSVRPWLPRQVKRTQMIATGRIPIRVFAILVQTAKNRRQRNRRAKGCEI